MTVITDSEGNRFRRAMVEAGLHEAAEVKKYVPTNFRVYENFDGCVMIEGFEKPDATLEHAMARLLAGLIYPVEVEV